MTSCLPIQYSEMKQPAVLCRRNCFSGVTSPLCVSLSGLRLSRGFVSLPEVPHPRGEIAVTLTLDHGKLEAGVTLPAGVTGQFEWRGQTRDLHPGENHLTL